MEMLGGAWQIWIRHRYFTLTFYCRQGLIRFWEQSPFLWMMSSRKRCSRTTLRLLVQTTRSSCVSLRLLGCSCCLLPNPHQLLVSGALELKFGVESSSKQAELANGWASLGDDPDLTLAPFTPLCFHTSHPHLLLGKGLLTVLWALNLDWSMFACFNLQLAPCLSLPLLLDICRRCRSSRAWHLGVMLCGWMWNADRVVSYGFVNGEILYQRAMENQAPLLLQQRQDTRLMGNLCSQADTVV